MGKSIQDKRKNHHQKKEEKPLENTPSQNNEGKILKEDKNEKTGKRIFWGISLLFLILFVILGLKAGTSGDEFYHLRHANDVINYYKTFGEDTVAVSVTAASSAENSREYGQAPDNIACLIATVFGIEDIIMVRHVTNVIFGWTGMLFAALLAYRISRKWYAAIITAVLLFLSPRYLGHSFNNLKDIPFSAMMMMGLYYIYYFLETMPRPPKKVVIMLAVSIGLAIGTRVGGLLLIAYFGLFSVVYFIAQWVIINRGNKSQLKAKIKKKTTEKNKIGILFKRLLGYGLLISLAGYFLAVLIWPYALEHPFKTVYEVYEKMAHFQISLLQLFEGSMQWSDILPEYYTPKYILMSVPVVVILGMILYPFVGGWKKENRAGLFFVYFAFIFPVFWIVYTNANVYGGWRHALFAYPPMVVAAGLGFNALVEFLKNKYLKVAAMVLPVLFLIMPLVHIIKNHPYEYIYFNKLAGGIDAMYGNYEMDYYYHTTREATEWIIANAEKSGLETGDKIIVASWHPASVEYFLRHDTAKFHAGFLRWRERGDFDWDYSIFVITGMVPEQIKSKHFPPKNTVHTIDVDGKPVCLILKRDDKSDWKGFQYKSENQIDSAIYYFKKALEVDEYNEVVMLNLVETYFQVGMIDSAKPYLDRILDFLPLHESANYMLAHYYLSKNNPNDALIIANKMIENNFKFRGAYSLACDIYLRQNNLMAAGRMLERLIDIDQLDNQSVKQLIEIYKAQGLNETGAYKKLYITIAQSFEKRGKKEEAMEYQNLANGIR
ncbi:MAG: tetratricopeptide repeat protein [Bacteroidales bacterium]|jgi:tetratricopeptide (TPR) repeat protein|nr:tetratricopeptide repeat protein [Bacteroidales bacterium]